MITLASIAYTPADQIASYLQDSSYSTQGQWSLVWGPCAYIDDVLYTDNLVYVAYNATTQAYAVVVRGTDLVFSGSTFIDLFEDLEVSITASLPFAGPPADAWIALGTATGLGIINDFTDPSSNQTLVEYLSSQEPSTLYVTGHSLGGCLASVLAPSLQSSLQQPTYPIIPYTFAAPTAGNAAYATWYSQAFPESYRYYNTNDAIPMAWNNLDGIAALFSPGPGCPLVLQMVLELKADYLYELGYDYTQPNGTGSPFTAPIVLLKDWYQEVLQQHGHATYLTGLGAQPVPLPPVFQVKPVQRNPQFEVALPTKPEPPVA